MVNPVKTTTRPITMPETKLEHKSVPDPIFNQRIEYQEKTPSGGIFIYVVLAIVVLVGGYFIYANEWPSTAVPSAVTKTDMAPKADAPTASTTVVPAAPMAATPPATTTQVPATPPAAGTAPAPATTTTP